MKRDLPPYVYRKGRKKHLWFVRRGWESKRVHAPYPSPEFYAELAMIQRGIPPVPKGKSFTALIARYKRSEKFTSKAPRTKKDYDNILLFFDERIGAMDPTKIRRKDIIRIRDDNADRQRFANYCVQIMRILMEYAIDIGWMDQNPGKGVLLLKSKKATRQPWPADLVAAYRKTAADRDLLIFELLLGTGQRIGDVLKMQWGHIEDGGIKVKQGKTGKELWIPFTPSLAAVLKRTQRRSVFILTNQRATGPWSYRGAAQAIRKVRNVIGAEDYDNHALRHTAASELFAAGCTDDEVKAITGHESTASIIRYGGAARQRKRALEAQKNRGYTK